jgi:hypothetical protein
VLLAFGAEARHRRLLVIPVVLLMTIFMAWIWTTPSTASACSR